jgi:hypothetical protein
MRPAASYTTPWDTIHDAPIGIALGHQLALRGWLVKADGKAITDRLVVRVDSKPPTPVTYGEPRPDVPVTLAAEGIPGADTFAGYSGVISTQDLTPGIHHLSLILASRGKPMSAIIARDIPFTVARVPKN